MYVEYVAMEVGSGPGTSRPNARQTYFIVKFYVN